MDHYLLNPYSNLDYLKKNLEDLEKIIESYESDTWRNFYQLYEKMKEAAKKMEAATEEAPNQELPSDKKNKAENSYEEAKKSYEEERNRMIKTQDEARDQYSGHENLKKKINELRQYLYLRLGETAPEWTGTGTLTEMKEYLTKLTDLISRHATTDNKKETDTKNKLGPYIYPTLNKWYFTMKPMKPMNDLSIHETILSQFAKWIFEIRLDQMDTGDETKNQEVKRFGKKTRRDSVIYLIEEGKKLFTERGASPEFWIMFNRRNIENW